MKYDVAESYADVQVLLEVLAGAHRQKASDRRGNLITAVLVGTAVVWAAFAGWGEADAASRFVAVALAMFGAGFPLALWIDGRTEYVFTPRTIEQRNPLWWSWTISAGEISRVTVEFTNRWMMNITTDTGTKRRMPIVESMSIALGTLYPTVFGPSEPVHLPRRLGYVMYAILAMAAVAFAVMVVMLHRRGLLEW